MKQKYRFVGTHAEIGETKLTKFGETIELTPEQRKDAGPRCPLVHEALFAKAGFTEQELSIYAHPGQRVDAPEPFVKKAKVAWGFIGQEPAAEVKQ
jgi:hypothetical protein